jgi:hypothetical protein
MPDLKKIWIDAWLKAALYRKRPGASIYIDLVEAASKAFATYDGKAHVENRDVVEPPLAQLRRWRLQDHKRLSDLHKALDKVQEALGGLALLTLFQALREVKSKAADSESRTDPNNLDDRRANDATQGVTRTFKRAIRRQLTSVENAPPADWARMLCSAVAQRAYNYAALRTNELMTVESGELLLRSRLAWIRGVLDAMTTARTWTAATPSNQGAGEARAQRLPTRSDLEQLARDLRASEQQYPAWELAEDHLAGGLPEHFRTLLEQLQPKPALLAGTPAASCVALRQRLWDAAALVDELSSDSACFAKEAAAGRATIVEHGEYLRELEKESRLANFKPANVPLLPRILLEAVGREEREIPFDEVALTVLALYLRPRGQFNEKIRNNTGAKHALMRFKDVFEAAEEYCERLKIEELAAQHLVARLWLLADLFAAAYQTRPEQAAEGRLEIASALLGMIVCRNPCDWTNSIGYIQALQYPRIVNSPQGQLQVKQLMGTITDRLQWDGMPLEAGQQEVPVQLRHFLTNEWEIHAQYAKGVIPSDGRPKAGNSSYPLRKAVKLIGLPEVPRGTFRMQARGQGKPGESQPQVK